LTGRIADIDAELFDLIARLEASLDFPDEGYHFVEPGEVAVVLRSVSAKLGVLLCDAGRGRLIREGARVAIAGKPNVGKSSLFNALLRASRAIVTPVAGTTRDLVTETADVDGLRLELVDTAGIRLTHDPVELEGVSRARRAAVTADLVLVVLDRSQPLDDTDHDLIDETAGTARVMVANKSDLPAAWAASDLPARPEDVSSRTGTGLDGLRGAIRAVLEGDSSNRTQRDSAAVTNVRHADLLARARRSVQGALDAVENPNGAVAEEFVLSDLHEARAMLEEVTGRRTSEDMLRQIFSRFCIGK
jgi:tRNA modification GTPase